jgi:hypothetical protein
VISPELNFVFPCYRGEDIYAYIHTRPIPAAAFDMSYRLLIRTFNTMLDEGPVASRFADKFLRDAATALNTDATPLLNEIGRLSSVIMAAKDGWQQIPLQQAVDGKMLDPEDAQSAVNAALFFSCIWHVSPKKNRMGLLQTGAELWGWQSTPSSPMEWIASLPKSTTDATSAPTPRGTEFVVQGLAPAS